MKIDKPRTNVEAIIRFMTKDDIMLNAEQEALLLRLCFVDTLLRSRKYKRDTIIEMTKKRFSMTDYRASQDITDAHKVFGETRKLNKNYLLSHHIEEIALQIQVAKDAGRLELLPKLNDNYTYAVNSIPAHHDNEDHTPAKIVFVYNGAPELPTSSLSELLLEADNFIKGNKQHEYIDYEEAKRPG